MRQKLSSFLRSLGSWYSAHRDGKGFAWCGRLLAFGVLVASSWFIARRLRSDYAAVSESEISFTPWRLLVSWLCVTASTALGAWEWSLLVNALGGKLETLRGMRIHLVSSLAKYVPGGIWSYVGKAYLATEQGVPVSIATASVIGEFMIMFLDGLILLMLSSPYSAIAPWSEQQRMILQLATILVSGAGLACLLLLGSRWSSLGPRDLGGRIKWPQVAVVVVAVLLTWTLLGLGFSVLGTSDLVPNSPSTSHWLFSLASALLAGQVAFFAPMGLGVREAVFIELLDPWYQTAFILVVAVAFRIEMILGEVLCALVVTGAAKWAGGQDNSNGLLT